MEEPKRDFPKPKRSKTDHVKNIVQSYLQKRNYAPLGIENCHPDQHLTYSLIENEISRPNSILYSCYNSDSVVIDHNFTKFLTWLKDCIKTKNCNDLEHLIAPFFCHLYLDILKGGHSDRAANFLKAHLLAIDKTKCDDFVKDLLNLFANDCDATCMIEQFRNNKYFIELSPQSLDLLKKFVGENCHVVFLHVLQTWFDIRENDEQDKEIRGEMDDKGAPHNGVCLDDKFRKILDAINDLEKEPKQIFIANISHTNDPISCAVIKRNCGLIAYNQNNVVHLRPVHSFDPILGLHDCKEIKFYDHTKRVYSITISPDCSKLVTGSEDSNLCLYDLNVIKLIRNCGGHLGPIYCTSISSNSVYCASGSCDTTARLWDLETGHNLRVFVGHTQAITCIDFHPNCLYVATGGADRNIRLWSVDNGTPLRLFHGCKGVVYGVAFSPLGDTLASVSDDKKIRLWDILNSKINNEIKQKGLPGTKLVWSSDGKQLCTGAIDGVVRVWDLRQIDSSEPQIGLNVNGKILHLEYSFDTFACVT
ncbi:TAF5-like RNA polymerase II p300/CBP-associated factor-associated factor 65 kDa subunit 5L [Tribolium madens]|uniref:TAF5-like RNA polymerase II p300/CBP-associated factor-associated factor 65 kDa subunit 5L n=1 Tax=Tribolium madens TaxID=41895 RepID=UPI001CF72E23|nr:TAF5-like RNA polymerase II p300/CBP-associated factor-associated factor 65 kDa subunit 5L [Tribolium madens]